MSSTQSPDWGISSSAASIAAGSNDEHGAKVRDAKRKDLLRANGHVYHDIGGNFKRRSSDDASVSGSVDPLAEEEGDALVYVYHVQVADTMAGVALKYNCEASVIRKANRMWPNDTIQVRKTIVLPVDACGVKGRPCAEPNTAQEEKEEDLLGDDAEALSMHESATSFSSSASNDQRNKSSQEPSSTESQNPPFSVNLSNADAPPWKHDSWVLLPGFSTPVEIARLPRRHLGFFPRARRKSNTYSDLGTSTPKTSFDFSRTASSPASTPKVATSPRASLNTNRPNLAPSPLSSRHRSNSQPFTSLLHGPGGVGTLDRTTRVPGPAQDSLNRILGPHLPNVEPPSYQTVYTPWLTPAKGDLDELISFNNYRQKGVGGGGSAGMEWQEVGGAIEKWIRRTAKKAATALEASSSSAAKDKSAAAAVGAGSGMGDLIELVDSFEAVDGRQEENEQGNLLYMGLGGSSCMGSSGMAVGSEGRDGIRDRSRGRSMEKSGKVD